MLNIFKKNKLIFKTGFLSFLIILIFLGSVGFNSTTFAADENNGSFLSGFADWWNQDVNNGNKVGEDGSFTPMPDYTKVDPQNTFAAQISNLGTMLNPSTWIDKALTSIGNTILKLSAQVLAIAGILFNISLEYTLNFKNLVDQLGMVNIGWSIIRDLSNMIFIFLLLFISIGTILGLSSYNIKNSLKNIIIVALLINFSLFFTSVIIDTSNIIGIGFYNAITQEKASSDLSFMDSGFARMDKGISATFSQALNLETIYDGKLAEGDANKKIFTIAIFGSIFLLITAFVFFAAAILFVVRIVSLMFLMMLSPLAFIGMILPKTGGLTKKWWNELFSQAFFAPIYLMFVYIVAKGINDPAFSQSLGDAGNNNFAEAFAGGGSMIVIFNFILITFFMVGALISAKSLGAKGASSVIKIGEGVQKWGQGRAGAATFGAAGRLGRNTVGALASKGAENLGNSDHASKWYGKMGLKGLRNVADSSFDARNTEVGKATLGKIPGGVGEGIKGGYKTKVDERRKSQIKFAQALKGDITDSAGNKISRTEAYGQSLKDKTESRGRNASIFTTMFRNHEGDVAAAKALVNLPKHEREMETAKNKLKREKRELENINKDYVSYEKAIDNGMMSSKESEVLNYKNRINDKKDEIEKMEDEIEKIKGKITKIKDSTKDKSKTKDSSKDKK
ncbi:MAG: hypothetical protein KAJ58_00400 [Candidatus Pacebacteria bacterium]|nr:hypothetical protein [Candidatus Paceibacterota bacterium]